MLENAAGDRGRLSLTVRGETLHATLVPDSTESGARLSGELEQLQRALRDRGFVDPQVRVQSPAPAAAGSPETRPDLSQRHDARREAHARQDGSREGRQGSQRSPRRAKEDA